MKETGFIKQNKEKWIEFEKILHLKKKDPDRLSNLFIQITDDLSYSRTFYPNRSVRVYLNNIAQQVFYSIYRNKRERRSRFWLFWREELPKLVYDSGRELRLSLIVFILAVIIGVVSCHYDPEFMRVILGDDYVEMTKRNIEKGDPMAVYKEWGEMDMMLYITFNNLRVAFLTFLLGILCGVGSIAFMAFNGIMIGVFQYYFIQRGLFWESFLTVWLHGTLEIASFVIAGGAGITLGKGLVFPGTYSRMEAFQVSARRGLRLLLGVLPIIVFAALIESFVTRYTGVPDFVKASLIIVSWAFIIGYFVWYPYMKAKKGFSSTLLDDKLPPSVNQRIDCTVIKNNGEIFTDTFVFLKRYGRPVLYTALGLSALYAAVFAIFFANDFYFSFNMHYDRAGDLFLNAFYYLGDLAQYFSYDERPGLMAGNLLLFSTIAAMGAYFWKITATGKKQSSLKSIYDFGKALIILSIISLATWAHPLLFFLVYIFVFPVLMMWLVTSQIENKDLFSGLGRSFSLFGGSYFSLVGLNLIFMVLSILFLFLIASPIMWIFFGLMEWGFDLTDEEYLLAFKIVITVATFIALPFLFLMTYSGTALFYFSSKEKIEAQGLKERIRKMGAGKPRAAAANDI
jgi:uncharacterized membrane protein SpoIIM required for sporulation